MHSVNSSKNTGNSFLQIKNVLSNLIKVILVLSSVINTLNVARRFSTGCGGFLTFDIEQKVIKKLFSYNRVSGLGIADWSQTAENHCVLVYLKKAGLEPKISDFNDPTGMSALKPRVKRWF